MCHVLGCDSATVSFVLGLTASRQCGSPAERRDRSGVRPHMDELCSAVACGPSSSGAAMSSLLRLNVGRADYLSPLLGLFGDELAEIGRRATEHHAIQGGKPRLDFRIGEAGIDLLVQLLDNFG